MKDKATWIMGGIIILLLVSVSSLLNTNTRKDGQIELLEAELKTAESVNQGLKDSVEKLVGYFECTAKIWITPRSLDKSIAGSVDDPETALKRCRIEVNGVPVSENPPETPPESSNPQPTPQNPSQTPQNSPQQQNPSSPPAPTPPEEPPEPPDEPDPIIPIFDDPILPCIGTFCLL